jgi:hypothetical protein
MIQYNRGCSSHAFPAPPAMLSVWSSTEHRDHTWVSFKNPHETVFSCNRHSSAHWPYLFCSVGYQIHETRDTEATTEWTRAPSTIARVGNDVGACPRFMWVLLPPLHLYIPILAARSMCRHNRPWATLALHDSSKSWACMFFFDIMGLHVRHIPDAKIFLIFVALRWRTLGACQT